MCKVAAVHDSDQSKTAAANNCNYSIDGNDIAPVPLAFSFLILFVSSGPKNLF